MLHAQAIITDFERTGVPSSGWQFGQPGDPIRIDGSGFTTGGTVSAVRFGGVNAPGFFAVSDSTINVNVPVGAASGFISVVKGITESFSTKSFTVIGSEPYIFSLSTNRAGVGTPITIEGDNFTSGGFSIVTGVNFNGTTAAFALNEQYRIQATVPANATTGPIAVTTTQGSGNSSTNFFYFTPAITNFIPSNAPPGTLVTIGGQNFLGASAVIFANGQNATFNVLSNTLLTATVPAGARTGRIFVIAPAGTAQSSNNFLVPPTLGGFTPSNGPVGTVVNIRGTNLYNVSEVTFNGVAGTGLVTNAAGTNVTATVASGTTTGFIVVTGPSGAATSAVPFYLPPQFNNPGLAPSQGRAGTNVVLTGVNFSNATAVTFNGVAAVFSNLSPTSIGAIVPGAALTGPVVVSAPGGQTTSPVNFRVQPAITGFNPTSGFPGDEVVITGTNFTANSVVTFNLSNAVVTAVSLTSLTARVPTNTTTGTIRVSTDGGVDESAGVFTVLSAEIELTVAVTNGAVVVSWPTAPAGFRLQAATNWTAPIFWTNAGGVTSVFNGRFNVTNPATGSNGFFRLILP